MRARTLPFFVSVLVVLLFPDENVFFTKNYSHLLFNNEIEIRKVCLLVTLIDVKNYGR